LFLTAKRPTQTLSNNSRSEAHPMN